jgi:hypothetical protein
VNGTQKGPTARGCFGSLGVHLEVNLGERVEARAVGDDASPRRASSEAGASALCKAVAVCMAELPGPLKIMPTLLRGLPIG